MYILVPISLLFKLLYVCILDLHLPLKTIANIFLISLLLRLFMEIFLLFCFKYMPLEYQINLLRPFPTNEVKECALMFAFCFFSLYLTFYINQNFHTNYSVIQLTDPKILAKLNT